LLLPHAESVPVLCPRDFPGNALTLPAANFTSPRLAAAVLPHGIFLSAGTPLAGAFSHVNCQSRFSFPQVWFFEKMPSVEPSGPTPSSVAPPSRTRWECQWRGRVFSFYNSPPRFVPDGRNFGPFRVIFPQLVSTFIGVSSSLVSSPVCSHLLYDHSLVLTSFSPRVACPFFTFPSPLAFSTPRYRAHTCSGERQIFQRDVASPHVDPCFPLRSLVVPVWFFSGGFPFWYGSARTFLLARAFFIWVRPHCSVPPPRPVSLPFPAGTFPQFPMQHGAPSNPNPFVWGASSRPFTVDLRSRRIWRRF